MRVRFLLGPAGSGKTFRCLEEVRSRLTANPEGPPLLFIAPKQSTYQVERQLLANGTLAGFTRLRILSFERLAAFVFEQAGLIPPELLDEEGRIMVLRALLAARREKLKVFRGSARLPGFARQLSDELRELQQHRLTPAVLARLMPKVGAHHRLDDKLHDLSLLLEGYHDWLDRHQLQDGDRWLELATDILKSRSRQGGNSGTFWIEGLWMDGFAQMTPRERGLLMALIGHSHEATLAFCLEQAPSTHPVWYSQWALLAGTYRQCVADLAAWPECTHEVETLARRPEQTRFESNLALQHLERHWADPRPFQATDVPAAESGENYLAALRIVRCSNPEMEAVLAARVIRQYASEGGRYREVAVQVRSWEPYHAHLQRVFRRYDIPFFMDRRESVAHHPLAELSRSALRTLAFGWKHEDWFGALKSGLVDEEGTDVDWLENESLARGWEGRAWTEPLRVKGEPELAKRAESLRVRLVRPFLQLARALGSTPTGRDLAEGLRAFWEAWDVEETLIRWGGSQPSPMESSLDSSSSPREGRVGRGSRRGVAQHSQSSSPRPSPPSDGGEGDIRFFIPAFDVNSTTVGSQSPLGEAVGMGPSSGEISGVGPADPVHETVWDQMNLWLDNVSRAFPVEPQSLSQWMPILEAGLSGLTVGVVPPVLDQVLIGSIDRSRNPDLKMAIVLGWNETVFPAPPPAPLLLTESDRRHLEDHGHAVGSSSRVLLGHERFYGYIACTRAREKLILTYARDDQAGRPLNPSALLGRVRRMFPDLAEETFDGKVDLAGARHASELIPLLLNRQARGTPSAGDPAFGSLLEHPVLRGIFDRLGHWRASPAPHALAPALAERLYGKTLTTSVSRIEDFASCPFRFYVRSGLKVEERLRYELDIRQQGSFQHEVLARFHQVLQEQHKRWRDLTPSEAGSLIEKIAAEIIPEFQNGLLTANGRHRFLAHNYTEALRQFIEVIVGWMRQYRFDPWEVELGFGLDGEAGAPSLPPWELPLDQDHRLAFIGRIDRIDIYHDHQRHRMLCIVIDYKSGQRKVDRTLMEHGVQQQLPAYLNVLRHVGAKHPRLGQEPLMPAGVFYVPLRGAFENGGNRREVLERLEETRRTAFTHQGFADLEVLPLLDDRPGSKQGDQFPYRLTKDNLPYKNNPTLMAESEFLARLDQQKDWLIEAGQRIFRGEVSIDPWRKGPQTACDRCEFSSVCRIDPWTHIYRMLSPS